MHVLVDSTGVKIFGEVEWAKGALGEVALHAAATGWPCKANRGTVREQRGGKWRKCPNWREIHLARDETIEDTTGIEMMTANWGDAKSSQGCWTKSNAKSSLRWPPIAPTTPKVAMPPVLCRMALCLRATIIHAL
jgi:hypothetical protein